VTRRAEHQASRRDHRARRDQSARADDGSRADHGAVEHGRLHADKAPVLDAARVQDRAMADDDVGAHDARYVVADAQHGAILDVRSRTDRHARDVAAQNAAVPNARVGADAYVADEARPRSDEHPARDRQSRFRTSTQSVNFSST
jgi:hypothetical protein